MATFKATAINQDGLRFMFHFCNPNWHSIQKVADTRLKRIVTTNNLHQANGPWKATNIDVAV